MEEIVAEQFFLEIGTEEIPAGYIGPALEAMAATMTRFMDDNRIGRGGVTTTGTPRRLVLVIEDVAAMQESCTTEVIGPPKAAAYKDGKPTKAAEGFARGQGVAVEDLRIKETPKGEYLCVVRQETGLPTRGILEGMLQDFVARIPFPKSMRWADLSVTFARPIKWIVCLLGGEVLNFSYGNVASGRTTYGHRFMDPAPVDVTGYADYREGLRKQAVIVDIAERGEIVRASIHKAAESVGGRILEDEELVEEVTQLVEQPFPVVGTFEEKYLELPPELPITVIKKHQRYFAIVDGNGNLLPHFVTVANTVPRDPALVAAGNGRVVRARLEDARFYYREDLKVKLDNRAEQLKGVVFHSKMGTSGEKVERFSAVAKWLAEELAPASAPAVLRAAALCKADLVSGVVGEFPDLQGIMGRAYARIQGESEPVACAIYEHYLPNRAGGPIPETMEGAILSMADKIDTIVGCFGVGLIPTGTADPFALRRQTLGIIRIVLEKPLKVSLSDLIDRAVPKLKSKMTEAPETVKANVLDFFTGRLQNFLASQDGGAGPDVIEAALSIGIDDMVEAVKRVKAVAAFKTRPDFDSLAAAVKRVANIIKEPETAPVDPGLFQNAAEQALALAMTDTEGIVNERLAGSDYDGALEAMAGLKPFIDAFFDSVLVMDKDEAVKRNRLAILTRIRALFMAVADFRKIQTA